jgi:hypothetical protein
MSKLEIEKRKLDIMIVNNTSYKDILKQSQIVDYYITIEIRKQLDNKRIQKSIQCVIK